MNTQLRAVVLLGGFGLVLALAACGLPPADDSSIPEPPEFVGQTVAISKASGSDATIAGPVAGQTVAHEPRKDAAGTPTPPESQSSPTRSPTAGARSEEVGDGEAAGVDDRVSQPPLPEGAIGRLVVVPNGSSWPIFPASWKLISVEGQKIGQWQWVPSGAGHHTGTAWPGTSGNCVLSLGPEAVESRDPSWQLAVGERLETRVGDDISVYTVVSIEKIWELGAPLAERREHTVYMAPAEDARLTLIVCWPGWTCTHRMIYVAERR